MALFNISPLNSLQFVRRDDLEDSFVNTTYSDITGLSKKPYCQMVKSGDVITVQVKTDYTAVAAYLYNILTNTKTTLTPSLTGDYTAYDFWEIPITFSTEGYYQVFVSGTLSGSAPARWVSEVIEVKSSWTDILIEYYDSESTPYVDYSNGIINRVRVDGILRFANIGGKDEFYNNLGTEERIYSENETIYELSVEDVPYYLVRQLVYASRCDTFIVNDIEYVVKEHSINQNPGAHTYNVLLTMTQKEVAGINADDDGHTMTWNSSTSGDGITAANEVILTYDDYMTVVADLTHGGSSAGVPLTGTVAVFKDGGLLGQSQISWNNGGSIGTVTINAKIYAGHTYYLEYNF